MELKEASVPEQIFKQTFNVTGMTCEHCVAAVTSEISALPGVSAVRVDLVAGTAEVDSHRELGHDEVAAAVDEAGYALA